MGDSRGDWRPEDREVELSLPGFLPASALCLGTWMYLQTTAPMAPPQALTVLSSTISSPSALGWGTVPTLGSFVDSLNPPHTFISNPFMKIFSFGPIWG